MEPGKNHKIPIAFYHGNTQRVSDDIKLTTTTSYSNSTRGSPERSNNSTGAVIGLINEIWIFRYNAAARVTRFMVPDTSTINRFYSDNHLSLGILQPHLSFPAFVPDKDDRPAIIQKDRVFVINRTCNKFTVRNMVRMIRDVHPVIDDIACRHMSMMFHGCFIKESCAENKQDFDRCSIDRSHFINNIW